MVRMPYLDDEQSRTRIVELLVPLAKLNYDHDRDGALPVRDDVLEYTVNVLLRPALGPLHAGGLFDPAVMLNHDGTLTIGWAIAGPPIQSLHFHVPCRGVVAVTRRDGGSRVEETFRHLQPGPLALALDEHLDWFRHAHAERN